MKEAVGWYAVALATVHHYRLASTDEIAQHLHVTLAEWIAIDRAWTTALSSPGAGFDVELARFALLFTQARKRLMEGGGPNLADLSVHLRRLKPMSGVEPLVAVPAAPASLPVPPLGAPHADETLLAVAAVSGSVLPFDAPHADETLLAVAAVSGPVLPFVEVRSAQTGETCGHDTALLGALIPGPALPFTR